MSQTNKIFFLVLNQVFCGVFKNISKQIRTIYIVKENQIQSENEGNEN